MGLILSKDECLYQQVTDINGTTETLKSLCRGGASLEWVDKERRTPLIVACMTPEKFDFAKTLIQLGANVNAYTPGPHAGSPLHHAAKSGQEKLVKLLLAYGANTLMMNDDGKTALDVARFEGYSFVVRMIEWVDKEGRTPLLLACMTPKKYDYAKKLIELGANVNAYTRGPQAGSPLHHAARSGQEKTVKLLLSHGANALMMNDDGQTALDVARSLGYSFVVRMIEDSICLFSGMMQDRYKRQFRNVWVVIRPTGIPFKLELVIYSSTANDLEPIITIDMWKHSMKPPNFRKFNPSVVISFSNGSRIKLRSVNNNENQQLQRFCNACKGVSQVMHLGFVFNGQGSNVGPTAKSAALDHELDPTINASPQSGSVIRPTDPSWTNPFTQNNEHALDNIGTSNITNYDMCVKTEPIIPSAPPFSDSLDEGPVQYPYVDSTPIQISDTYTNVKNSYSSCVICENSPIEGACIPCGHMVACMSCLNAIHGKNWGCPVCRTQIIQIVKIYI